MALLVAPLPAVAAQANAAPEISHDPVTKAVKGQALTMKAKVTDDQKAVSSVTLFYTLSKDAAPFKVPLKPAGLDYYIGTIDAGVLSGVATMSYYIEAQDNWGATRETPWYVVTFRDPLPGDAVSAGSSNKVAAPEESSDHIPLGLIVGGAAAVIGGAFLIAKSDSGGGGDEPKPDDPSAKQGTYAGTVTTCVTASGQPPSCESHPFGITIDAKGKVLSTDIRQGQTLVSTLHGSDFTLTGSADDGAGKSGEIYYNGSVINNSKIVGSITGSEQGTNVTGSFSGSFSATKQ